jgi:hypothetical protein
MCNWRICHESLEGSRLPIHNRQGVNPADVAFYDAMPSDEEMLRIAKEIGVNSEGRFQNVECKPRP